jgi:signal transduction histidine kinase/CheY-like chemotaxis protein
MATLTVNQSEPSAAHIEAESVGLLYQHAWLMSLIVGATSAALTAYLFVGHAATSLIVAWLVFIVAVILARVGLILVFLRVRPARERYRDWGRYYRALAWVNGFAWGLPAHALDPRDPTVLFFYTLVIGGFVAGAIPGLSFDMKAFYGFSCLAALPVIVTLLTFDEEWLRIIGVLSLLFLVINTASARISWQRIRRQILLEYENQQLVAHLQAEKERAERANEVKTRFLAAASHDLRQPLNAIGLFVDALDARISFPEVRRIMDNLQASTQSLKGLLNAMLDISRLDAGALRADIVDFRLQPLLDELEHEFGPQAQNKGLSLRIRPCDAWVRSDPIMLGRVLRNLLSNAIRYSSSGGVLLGCRRRGEGIRIDVCDTGAGIPTSELEHVFEEFYQLENPERDRDKGLGLGLAIVRRLTSLLNHELNVRSRIGRGSVFSVTIARARTVAQPLSSAPEYHEDMAGTLIVVIDDDAPIRTGMDEVLRSWGCKTILADSADSALQQIADEPRMPDLIIADYRLREGKTGVQGIERISTRVGRRIPAIIVTGDIAPERVAEAKLAGYRLLHKPVSAASLRSLASYLVRKPGLPIEALRPPAAG